MGSAFRRTFFKWKLWLVWWAVNCVIAWIAASPLVPVVFAKMSLSLAPRGQPLLSSSVLLSVGRMLERGGALTLGPLLMAFFLTALAQPLLAGGTLAELMSNARFRFSGFASECAHLFGRNLRLSFFAAPVFVLAVGVVGGSAFLLHSLHHLTLFTVKPEAWVQDRVLTKASLAHALFTVLVLAFWRTYLDLARGLLVQQQVRRSRAAAWRAFKLVLRAPLLVLGYAFLGALGLVGVWALMGVHARIDVSTVRGAALAFGVAQLVLLVRQGGMLLSTALVAARLVRSPPPLPLPKVKGAVTPPPPPPPAPPRIEPMFPSI